MHKREAFTRDENCLADYMKALGHPARIAILKAIAEKKSCICGDLVVALPLAQSTVSQHVKELKEAGLVKGTVDGPRSCYCIDPEAMARLEGSFGKFCASIVQKCC